MVNYISRKEAQARVRDEPVIFAEVLSQDRQGQKLEVHDNVDEVIARVAAAHRVRYATIRRAEDHWPPDWVVQAPG